MSKRPSQLQQVALHMDHAIWFLKQHPGDFLLLSIPATAGAVCILLPAILMLRHWDLPWFLAYLVFGILAPALLCWLMTLCPLPGAVYAWSHADGTAKSPGEAFRFCRERMGKLSGVGWALLWRYVLWFVLFGLPFLKLWPATCLAPQVVLFEDDPRIFKRSKKLLQEDAPGIHLLLYLHLGLLLCVAVFVETPRLLLLSSGWLFKGENLDSIRDSLWYFELPVWMLGVALFSMCWAISLTLLYRHVRQTREGTALSEHARSLMSKYAPSSAGG